MYYAKPDGVSPKYKRDEEGNVVTFTDSEGNEYFAETGELVTHYATPVEFKANIVSTLASATFRPFGIDNSAKKATLCCEKDYLPIEIGCLIWKKSEIKRLPDGSPDGTSADYIVKDTALEGLESDLYLLEKLNRSQDENN